MALPSNPNGVRKCHIRTGRLVLLKDVIYVAYGRGMTLHATQGAGVRLHRYLLSTRDAKEGHGASGRGMLSGKIEEAMMARSSVILCVPEMVVQVWRKMGKRDDATTKI